jgi:hypothetical protein
VFVPFCGSKSAISHPNVVAVLIAAALSVVTAAVVTAAVVAVEVVVMAAVVMDNSAPDSVKPIKQGVYCMTKEHIWLGVFLLIGGLAVIGYFFAIALGSTIGQIGGGRAGGGIGAKDWEFVLFSFAIASIVGGISILITAPFNCPLKFALIPAVLLAIAAVAIHIYIRLYP